MSRPRFLCQRVCVREFVPEIVPEIMPETITITLKLFAIYREALGVPEQTITLPVGTTAGEVCDRILTEHPHLSRWRDLTRFGINLQFAAADTPLQEGDELVLIPPVSGG